MTDKTKTNRRIERVLSPEKRDPNDSAYISEGVELSVIPAICCNIPIFFWKNDFPKRGGEHE